jgi:hypothetical protein
MNKDVRIGTNYPEHPKIRKLYKRLGGEGIKSHIFLLCYVGRHCFDGVLKDMDADEIEAVAKWRGDSNQFVDTLYELKLLDKNSNTYSIHDWLDWNMFAASFPVRSRIARANIKKRWEKKTKLIQENNTNGNSDSNTPSPSPRREGEDDTPPLEAGGGVSPLEDKPTVEQLKEWQQEIDNLPVNSELKPSLQSVFNRHAENLTEAEKERLAMMTE